MIDVFVIHLSRICRRLFGQKDLGMLWGPTSMVPQPRDFFEMVAHIRWFVGLGPQPRFDHFTYWEKFDYWAVFWGMGIIGGSGLMLWFPELFALRPARLDVQHRHGGARRRGAAGGRLHLHDSLLQRPPAAREVPDGLGDLHRPRDAERDGRGAPRRTRAPDADRTHRRTGQRRGPAVGLPPRTLRGRHRRGPRPADGRP